MDSFSFDDGLFFDLAADGVALAALPGGGRRPRISYVLTAYDSDFARAMGRGGNGLPLEADVVESALARGLEERAMLLALIEGSDLNSATQGSGPFVAAASLCQAGLLGASVDRPHPRPKPSL